MLQVMQTHLVAPLEKHFPLLYALLTEHIADDADYKVKSIMKANAWVLPTAELKCKILRIKSNNY